MQSCTLALTAHLHKMYITCGMLSCWWLLLLIVWERTFFWAGLVSNTDSPTHPPALPPTAALGMNEDELKANKQVTEYVVHDLNLEPALPFPDNSFDVITNAVSVDYLNKPLEVCVSGRLRDADCCRL